MGKIPTRAWAQQAIYSSIVEHGPQTQSELSQRTGIRVAGVSAALARMRRAGVVRRWRTPELGRLGRTPHLYGVAGG